MAEKNEAAQTSQQWWGEAATKIAVTVMGAIVLGLGAWMFSMYTQLITIDVKLTAITSAMNEAKSSGVEAKAMARENTTNINQLRSERMKPEDVQLILRPLEYRLNQLEKRKR